MIVHEIFAQISEGIVQNIMVCEDSYMADFLTKATYGEDAFAVQCNQYGCRIGDAYRDGMFYHIDEVAGEEKPVYQTPYAEDEVAMLKEIITPVMTMARMQAVTLSDDQAVQVPELYQSWNEIPEGQTLYDGKDGIHPTDRVKYKGRLCKVITTHQKQADWKPDTAPSLFTFIGEPEAGSRENPIIWVSGMESEEGKHYMDEEILYIGLEDSKVGLYGQPKELQRYFKEVE